MKNKRTVMLNLFFLFIPLWTGALSFKQHCVQEGENLFQISRRYNISLKEILKINNLNEKSVLREGAVIKIPVKQEVSIKTVPYTVQEGENLFRIGLKYNITVDKLCQINNFTEEVKLIRGMKINVPLLEKEIPPKEIGRERKEDANGKKSESGSFFYHTMKKGETLYKLSKIYNTELNALLTLNRISDSTILKPGIRIKIPGAAVQSSGIPYIPIKTRHGKNYLDYSLPLEGKVIPYVKSHYKGILIFSDTDRKVKSIDEGIVSHIETTPSFGLIVFIKHPNGLVSTYSGFSAVYVKKDLEVKPGDIIGYSGTMSKNNTPGILYSLQDGGKALSFDMGTSKFYK